MSKAERVYTIERLIRQRGCIGFRQLQQELEVSRATLHRDLDYLRDRLGAPIVYDPLDKGYRFDASAIRGDRHELPGLWFSEGELYSLLLAHQLLSEVDAGGLLSRHLQPLLDRIHQLLGATAAGAGDGQAQTLMQRVRIIPGTRRPVASRFFEVTSRALLQRRRLLIRHLARSRGEESVREVSPQRLVHHRGTWYLDAWCHRVDALRRFALDAVAEAELRDQAAKEVPLQRLKEAMDAGYGVFASGQRQQARLLFDAEAARWVAHEWWHAEQQGRWLDDGSWELTLPFTSERELAMDVLRHAGHVRVLAPIALANAVRGALQRALDKA